MRLQMTLLLGAAATAAVWAQAALPPGARQLTIDPRDAAAEATGIAAALAALGHAPLEPLKVSLDEAGMRRLRGRAARADGPAEGWPVPLYAEAAALCDADAARAICWRVTRLEIDGEAAALPTAATAVRTSARPPAPTPASTEDRP
ncbi:MAG: hypothetical protein AAFU61_07550 [Pseudomonadota bacterium]